MARTSAPCSSPSSTGRWRELVRGGKIYIAQPPLYQIKRKKREEYVDDDAQLNKILISLGADEVKLKNLVDGKVFTAMQLKEILELLERLAKFSDIHPPARRRFRAIPPGARRRRPASSRATWSKCATAMKSGPLTSPAKTKSATFHEENRDLNLFDEPPVEVPLDGSPDGAPATVVAEAPKVNAKRARSSSAAAPA